MFLGVNYYGGSPAGAEAPSDGLVAFARRDRTVAATALVVAALRTAAGLTAAALRTTALGAFLLLHQERVDVDELGLLEELTAGDILIGRLLGQESDVERLQVLVHIEVLLLQRTVLLVLQGAVEGAEPLDLYLLRLQQHLNQTAAELLQHAVNDVGGVDASVLRDVVSQLSGVQRLEVLDLCVPLAECEFWFFFTSYKIFAIVLKNVFLHGIRIVAASCIGWPTSRLLR